MDSKRKVIQIFNNNAQGSQLRGRPKRDGEIVRKQVLINAKLQHYENKTTSAMKICEFIIG